MDLRSVFHFPLIAMGDGHFIYDIFRSPGDVTALAIGDRAF